MKNKILSFIFGISLIIMLLASAIEIAVFDKNFFMSEADKNAVAENTGMTETEISQVTDEIFRYLKKDRMDFDIVLTRNTEAIHLFNEDEQVHMVDVQNLMVLQRVLLILSTALVMICGTFLYRSEKQRFYRTLFVGSLFGLLLLVLAAVIASGDFTSVFVRLHQMIFSNELWLMDPETEVLINIVPEPYFIHLALYTGCVMALGCSITGIAGWIGMKKK